MGKRKGKRNYTVRKCGKPADKARCDMPGVHCINCSWPQTKSGSSAATMIAEGSGKNVPMSV
jgi:hypothetical protein